MRPSETELYHWLTNTATKSQWEKTGIRRRAGTAVPLFSIYSKSSIGIGEFPDIRLLADWCLSTGMSMIQLLPLNDVGFDFTPYDSQSMFALDPVYLSLSNLEGIDAERWPGEMKKIRDNFPAGREYVDYGVKKAKLELLWIMFQSGDWSTNPLLGKFREENSFWLENYSLFKVIKFQQAERGWQEWPEDLKYRKAESISNFIRDNSTAILFQEWLQWQCYAQMTGVKRYCIDRGILLMGDLPFLVSRDSADVWGNQDYFKLDMESGAPPDLFFAKGQRWGMPPYNWANIAGHGYDYLIEKLKYAQNFYDLYRIDHFVGIFRIWTISRNESRESGGSNGIFDPPDENVWEEHGKKLLDVMLKATTMLPCAEDLGTVPDCSYKVIKEYGVVGTDVQRWSRDWKGTLEFLEPSEYRPNSIVVLSTHDLTNLKAWWEYEIGTVDEMLFRSKCAIHELDAGLMTEKLFENPVNGRLRWRREIDSPDMLLSILQRPEEEVMDIAGMYKEAYDEKDRFLKFLGMPAENSLPFTPELALKILEAANSSASVFSVQMLPDWLWADASLGKVDAARFRINCPGTICNTNWSLTMPFSLEDLLANPFNQVLSKINKDTGGS